MKPGVKPLLFMVAAVTMAAGWLSERTVTTELRGQLADQGDHRREVDALRREQDRLRTLKRSADEQIQFQADAAKHEAVTAPAQPEGLSSEKWLPPGAWKNRGCATPSGTLETMLWAAAGGEVAALGDMLYFDGAAEAKINAIYAQLPAEARTQYVSPAQLFAAFTTAAIPIGDAQLVWQRYNGSNEAEACVRITLPDHKPLDSSTTSPRSNLDALIGPTWRLGQKNVANFTLRRSDGAWRLVVPASAVAKVEKEIGRLK
ncbi:MAG: hypothetical protein V4773_19205 [Verrucomicrobiota bacterium]